ncbi:2-oxo-4-hydroxy-4-carboxy-5-ureidoimidazoline decarboxylase [Nakamurella sp. PAMC28650]|uniref:2-oxo-4-hydroxy-4-carboxy-5-ureidoimidazoline decarboxylase n=1 Tax=Nakamurella sp. PAMC28650 TaxID=2762325 RepID=UPI001C9AFAF7|nr:2-oxo-4-hydroxy-4-carboxy-5-ureidoimidazoline decarboxylase [Nakamurella sp. PAMC28650]
MAGHHRGRHAVAFADPHSHPAKGRGPMVGGASAAGRHRAPGQGPTLAEFNADAAVAAEILGACMDIALWVAQVSAGRPFADLASLRRAGSAAAAVITWEQVAGALDRHPRIGERRAAVAGTGTESAWSGAEQSGVEVTQAQALAAGNVAYEQRFGHLFLICAAGLSGEQILAALDLRLRNEPAVEKPIVIQELRKISALRLAKAVVS